MYTIYRAAGWHGEPEAPIIGETDDKREAALRAGCRADLGMPGGSNPYDAYAEDEDGNEVDKIMSFCCDECGEIVEWGEYGPTGTMKGKILECPEAMESHLVTWICEDCASDLDEEEDEEEE